MTSAQPIKRKDQLHLRRADKLKSVALCGVRVHPSVGRFTDDMPTCEGCLVALFPLMLIAEEEADQPIQPTSIAGKVGDSPSSTKTTRAFSPASGNIVANRFNQALPDSNRGRTRVLWIDRIDPGISNCQIRRLRHRRRAKNKDREKSPYHEPYCSIR